MGDGEDRPRERRRSFPSPSSSSSSDFEFTVSLSPSSKRSAEHLCPADELFYKGQLLPLQLSSRISMVRTLLLASSSTSSSDATSATASRDSNGSSSSSSSFSTDALLLQVPDCDSSRPSSVTEEDACRRNITSSVSKRRYLSSITTRFSSVFLHRGSKKDPTFVPLSSSSAPSPAADKKPPTSSSLAKERIKKYVKKVKPLYEKLSSLQHKQSQQQPHARQQKKTFSFSIRRERESSLSFMGSGTCKREEGVRGAIGRRTEILSSSLSFSGNLRYSCAASCPSSMRSSPSHSGFLSHGSGGPGGFPDADLPSAPSSSSSSMEELQNAIQGAIAHCKNTIILAKQKKAIEGFLES